MLLATCCTLHNSSHDALLSTKFILDINLIFSLIFQDSKLYLFKMVLRIRGGMNLTNCPQLAQETALQDGQDKRF